MAMPRLKMIRGPKPGTEFDLEAETVSIGRGITNTIVIDDNEVSRHHCKFVRVLDDYELHDLQSTNGTFVNGQPVDTAGWLLASRQLIELGDSITLEYMPTESSANSTSLLTADGTNDNAQYYMVIHRKDREQPEIYALEGPSISIGRDLTNDIIVQATEVSRHHLRLARTNTGYSIEDLGSLNGTELNGKTLKQPTALPLNGKLEIGTTVVMYYTATPDLPPTASLSERRRQTDTPKSLDEVATRSASKSNTQVATYEVPDTQDQKRISTDQLLKVVQSGDLERQVFVAYDRRDWQPMVRFLYKYLIDEGIPTWVEQGLDPETSAWTDKIGRATNDCCALVLVVGSHTLKLPHIERAYRRFLMVEKPIVLVHYRDAQRLPMMLEKVPSVVFDAYKPLPTFQQVAAELRKYSNDQGRTRPIT
jgi:pSer/pThr/pTyr-binding forkhead associated (FHA) protein